MKIFDNQVSLPLADLQFACIVPNTFEQPLTL